MNTWNYSGNGMVVVSMLKNESERRKQERFTKPVNMPRRFMDYEQRFIIVDGSRRRQ